MELNFSDGLNRRLHMEESRLEILVFLQAFDEVFSNTVMTRSSYIAEEIIWGAKYKIMYSAEGASTILDLNKLNEIEKVNITQPLSD